MSVLIVLYGLSAIGAMIYRHKIGFGPTVAIFADLLWPLWLPIVLVARARGWHP